jgi:hypothetical protein
MSTVKPLRDTLRQPSVGIVDRLLSPVHVLLLKLLRPMIAKEEELLENLEKNIDQVQQQQRQLASMLPQISPEESAARLLALEQRLQQLAVLPGPGGR